MISNNKRKAVLEALTAYADELRTEIEHQAATLKRELTAVEQSIRAIAGDKTQDVGQREAGATLPVGGKYVGVGPQAAVEQYLQEHPGLSFRPAEIAAQLKAQGFSVSNPKLATQQVAIALIRAVGKGLAIQGLRQGRRAYRSTKQIGMSLAKENVK